jgi:hypothetical protein
MDTSEVDKVVDDILEHHVGFKIIDDAVTQSDLGEAFVDGYLEHFGVKGMQWGVRRKATVGPQEVIVRDSRFPGSKRLVAKGGKGHPATREATSSREIGRIGKKSGTKALTNKQLEDYNRRLNLEQNFTRLSYADKNPGQKFVAHLMGQTGKAAMNNANVENAKKVGRKAVRVRAGMRAAKAVGTAIAVA